MVNKVDAAKQIAEIFNIEWKEEFSALGSTITTIWFENIAARLNELQILDVNINFDEYIEGKNKIPKAKEIAKKTGFEIKEEWFSASKPGSTSNGGSTVKTPYFVEFLIWSKNNYQDKSSIKEIKSEIKSENIKQDKINGVEVPSPIIGTAYLAPEPGGKKFTEVGKKINKGDTIMIVEAMKTMNHVPSPVAGTVKKVCVEDGQPVEYGHTIAIID